MSQTQFEKSMMTQAEAFLNGDMDAYAFIYNGTINTLKSRAMKRGLSEDDAEDCASDAILYVQGRGRKTWDGTNILALLNRAVDWQAMNLLRDQRREVIQEDLPMTMAGDGFLDDEFETPMDLEELEEYRMQEGAMQHPYLTSITTRTPEDVALSENLREKLERLGREACGDTNWEIYAGVILAGKSQLEVATEYGISQQRVSQIITEVAKGVRAGLIGV